MLSYVLRRARALFAIAITVSGCGAKTGLEVPPVDAARFDAGPPRLPDGGPVCVPDVVLLPAHADVVLVLDRSGSMTRPLASSTTTRWSALHEALGDALPAFDAEVAFGASIFPIPGATISGGTVCNVGAQLDVPVALGSGAAITSALSAHEPSGGTPTADALAVATRALLARRREGVPQSIVLATDGGPNCDPADAAEPWFGQAPETCVEIGVEPELCLDRNRTVARIDEALARGVATYVIAMDVRESYLVSVLAQMAFAGGRPVVRDAEPFYDVRNPDDLRRAFQDIATRVSSCSFFPDGAITTTEPEVVVGGVLVPHDPTRTDGWAMGENGTYDLFGEACTRAMGAAGVVRLRAPCR